MKSLYRPLTTTFALVLSASSLFAEEALTLKQQWQPGKRYFQTMKMDQDMKLNFGGTPMNQKSAVTVESSISVTRHEDGKRNRIALKYDRMLLDVDMAGQKMVMDSNKPAEPGNPMGNPFAGVAGKEIRALTDESGKVVEIENMEALTAAGGNPMTSSMFNKESLIQSINQSALQAMPSKPVKTGDSWPFAVEVPMPGMGKAAMKGTYTFKGMGTHGGVPCAEIGVSGKIEMAIAPATGTQPPNPMAQMGMKLKEGTTTGTIWFDNALGTARGSDLTQIVSMSMKSPANPAETLDIPIQQHVSTELTKVEAIK